MAKTLQDQILGEVLSRYPKRSAAVESLSKLLGVCHDAIYRRFRGDTILSPNEIELLARTYNLSIDSYIYNRSDSLFFSYSGFAEKISNMGEYLDEVIGNLNKIQLLPDVKIYYAAREIPFFYYSFFPELICFKLYIWGRTVWEFDYLKNRSFEFDVMSHPEMEKTKQVLKSYLEIDTYELWSPNIMHNTLSQIEYFSNMDLFKNRSDALVLCDKLLELIEHWRNMAQEGSKYFIEPGAEAPQSSFNLFHHEMLVTSDIILVSSPAKKVLFNIYNNPNYLVTTNEQICQHQADWFEKAISKSIPISKNNEKSRALYFNGLKRKVQAMRGRIELG